MKLVTLLCLLSSLCVAQPLYLTIVTHNEEPNARQPDYLNKDFYLRNRELVRQLALTIKPS